MHMRNEVTLEILNVWCESQVGKQWICFALVDLIYDFFNLNKIYLKKLLK